jgi:hypothetical protein
MSDTSLEDVRRLVVMRGVPASTSRPLQLVVVRVVP